MGSASSVSAEYQPPFRYAGTYIDVAPTQLSARDRQTLRTLALMARLGIG